MSIKGSTDLDVSGKMSDDVCVIWIWQDVIYDLIGRPANKKTTLFLHNFGLAKITGVHLPVYISAKVQGTVDCHGYSEDRLNCRSSDRQTHRTFVCGLAEFTHVDVTHGSIQPRASACECYPKLRDGGFTTVSSYTNTPAGGTAGSGYSCRLSALASLKT